MDPYGKQELLSFFDRHLRDHGDTPSAVRWTPEGQRRRYESFQGFIGDLAGKSLLDFGCGKGDFYGFLRGQGETGDYCGIDVNAGLTSLARRKYPEAEFLTLDVEEVSLERRFDVVVACGVFNLRIGGIAESMRETVKTLYGLCRESLHLNFLTARAPQHDVELFYIDPADLLCFALEELSPIVTLRHGFVPDDVYLSVFRSSQTE
jgi:SAM-dependent methyltransferase